MWRTISQPFARTAARSIIQRSHRRFVSSSPQPLQSSLPGTIFRWGLAAGVVYWYNTSPLFAEQPPYSVHDYVSDEYKKAPRLEDLSKSSRFTPPHPDHAPTIPAQPSSNSPPSLNPKAAPPKSDQTKSTVAAGGDLAPQGAVGGPAELEEEASQQGAFNEETGEINWDCPCLGGMAHGPCGEDFKAAFSCFVYSNEEPKGMDCIDKFKGMQDCFRKHPEIYGEEMTEDEQVEPEQALKDAEEEEKEHGAMQEKMKNSRPMNTTVGGETSKEAAAALKEKSDGSKATFVDGKADGTVRTALDPAAASDARTAAVADASDAKESSNANEKSQ